jgi:hypothetical protein
MESIDNLLFVFDDPTTFDTAKADYWDIEF